MGKGRAQGHYYGNRSRKNPQAELAIWERLERLAMSENKREQVNNHIVKGGRKKTVVITDRDGTKVVYTRADELSSFTCRELFNASGIEGIDMSEDLNPAISVETMTAKLANNMDETTPKFRIYMRDSINAMNFSMLQHLVETMYMPEPLEELQGWIMHYGPIFVLGSVSHDLNESVDRSLLAVKQLAEFA